MGVNPRTGKRVTENPGETRGDRKRRMEGLGRRRVRELALAGLGR